MLKRNKEAKPHRWYETNDPAKAIGLWSHFKTFTTTLHPIDPTRQTMGRFFNDDLAKFETRFEAYEKIAAKGWRKTPARKLQEYAEEYKRLGIAAPRWFRAWRRFAGWLVDIKTEKPSEDVRLSFGYSVTGVDCDELKHRTSRLIFLRKGGRNFLAVMMKDGWGGWDIIEKTAYQPEPYERLVMTKNKGCFWQTVDADIITELVKDKRLCLFAMDKDPWFDALTGEKNGAKEKSRINRRFSIYVHDPNGPEERFRRAPRRHSPTSSFRDENML